MEWWRVLVLCLGVVWFFFGAFSIFIGPDDKKPASFLQSPFVVALSFIPPLAIARWFIPVGLTAISISWLSVVLVVFLATLVDMVRNYGHAYNWFMARRESVELEVGAISVAYKKQLGILPSVMEVCRSYAEHEKETFSVVASARTNYLHAKNVQDEIESINVLDKAIPHVLSIAEAHPELHSNKFFSEWVNQIVENESDLALAKHRYNKQVHTYNTFLQSIPHVLLKLFHGLKPFTYILHEDAVKHLPSS